MGATLLYGVERKKRSIVGHCSLITNHAPPPDYPSNPRFNSPFSTLPVGARPPCRPNDAQRPFNRGLPGSDGWATKIRNPKHEARNNIECSTLKDLSTAERSASGGSIFGFSTFNLSNSALSPLSSPIIRVIRVIRGSILRFRVSPWRHDRRVVQTTLKDLLTADYPPSPWDGLRRGERGLLGWDQSLGARQRLNPRFPPNYPRPPSGRTRRGESPVAP